MTAPDEKTEALEELTFQEETFVLTYFSSCGNLKSACTRSGINYAKGTNLLKTDRIKATLASLRGKRSEQKTISQERIIGDLFEMFTANMSDVVEHVRGSCRYCWGRAGQYHWRSFREKQDRKSIPPGLAIDDTNKSDGGIGYSEYRAPNPDCQECAGNGLSFVYLKDTTGRKEVQSLKLHKGNVTVETYDKVRIGEILLRHLSNYAPPQPASVVNTGPHIHITGGLSKEFVDSVKSNQDLTELEAQVAKEGYSRVAALEAEATADEQAEIDAMIARGEHNE
ncbi:terminase small subunit [Paraburkholderia caribensis]|uniref:terminase small subunit n=1 Tax=Paraburkholderia caribensis TaxID=75105 RepID=UPI002090D830|nr:terminase small subunit [Paraburkholderia caribensis]